MKNRYIQIISFLIALLSFATFPACEVDDEVKFVTEQEPVTQPELTLPKVSNPGVGKTTIVLYIPENTPAGCYAVGDMNGWNVENTEFRFMPVQGVDDKRWVSCTIDYESYVKMKVLAIPNAVNVSLGWEFQWGKNMDSGNDLEEDNVVILDGVGTLLLENQGQPMLCELADNGVVYIQVKSWTTNPPYTPNLLKGSKVWTILVDTVTAQVNASKIVADFGPDDEAGRYLYIWDNSYSAGNNWNGKNFYGVSYDYTSLLVGNIGWAGCGFNLPASDSIKAWEAAEALRTAIVASPDDYYLHMALKSTDNASHCFYIFNTETTKFTIGSIPLYDGPIYANFTRDGEWAEFDIPMSRFATALATITFEADMNIFVALSEGISGAQLNMDAIYFFKKADGDNLSVQKTSPSVTTAVVTQITETSAVVGGNVTSDGGASVTERGVVYSTNPNPVITNLNNTIHSCGSGTGEFTYTITGLQSGTTYYVRAYAKNDAGTAYGEEVTFTPNKLILETMYLMPPQPSTNDKGKQMTFDGSQFVLYDLGYPNTYECLLAAVGTKFGRIDWNYPVFGMLNGKIALITEEQFTSGEASTILLCNNEIESIDTVRFNPSTLDLYYGGKAIQYVSQLDVNTDLSEVTGKTYRYAKVFFDPAIEVTISGVANIATAHNLDYMEVVNSSVVKFLGEKGMYEVYYLPTEDYIVVEPLKDAVYPNVMWMTGVGFGLPVAEPKTQGGWGFDNLGQYIACRTVAPKVYQFTAYLKNGVNADFATYGSLVFKFFHQKGWGGEESGGNYEQIGLPIQGVGSEGLTKLNGDTGTEAGNWIANTQEEFEGIYRITLDQNKFTTTYEKIR